MSVPQITVPELYPARDRLSQFVRHQAHDAAAELGFGWGPSGDAPETFPELQAAFDYSQESGEPLPISELYCDDTIFLTPEDNIAFRFWHDTSHCRLGLSFSLPDEWRLTLHHLNALERAGFEPDSDEYRLLRLDLLGQVILLGVAGRFPVNQGHFVRSCATVGLDVGILHELERVS